MKEKDIKKEVKLLAKQGYFDDIYQQYGPKYFRKYVSRSYRKKDIRKLAKEGKYFDIYEKYGEKYIDYLSIYAKDVRNEVGRKRSLPIKIVKFGRDFMEILGVICVYYPLRLRN